MVAMMRGEVIAGWFLLWLQLFVVVVVGTSMRRRLVPLLFVAMALVEAVVVAAVAAAVVEPVPFVSFPLPWPLVTVGCDISHCPITS